MKLLKRQNMVNQKKANALQTTDISDLVKKADYNTNFNDIEKWILIMINILLLKNIIT